MSNNQVPTPIHRCGNQEEPTITLKIKKSSRAPKAKEGYLKKNQDKITDDPASFDKRCGDDIRKKHSTNFRLPAKLQSASWWKLILIFVLGWLALFGWYSLKVSSLKKTAPFWQLTPRDSSFFIWLKTPHLLLLAKGEGLKNSDQENFFLKNYYPTLPDILKKTQDFLKQTGLELEKDILEPLEEKIGLGGWLNQSANPQWFVILQKKTTQKEQFNLTLARIEQRLKQYFYLSTFPYRQTNIISLKSPTQAIAQYYYAQPKNYFLLTNDLGKLQELIDLIIAQ